MPGAPAGTPVLAMLGRGVLDPATPVVRADDAGVTRGDGCFEGCRLCDGRVDKPDLHFARMRRSAAALEIPFDEPAWRLLLDEAVAAWVADHGPTGEAAIKLVLTRGPGTDGPPTGYVWIAALSPDILRLRRRGLRVITLDRALPAAGFTTAPWLLGGVKTLSYAVNMAAGREAARRGADDVIFVSSDGHVLEAPTASVIWAVGPTLHTTPVGDTGILAGTTEHLVFEQARAAGWRTAETLGTVDDLRGADAVWLASSVRGPVDVVALDGEPLSRRPDLDAQVRTLAGFPATG